MPKRKKNKYRNFSIDNAGRLPEDNTYVSDSKSRRWAAGREEPIPVGKDLSERRLLQLNPEPNRDMKFRAGDYRDVPVQHVPTTYLNWIVRNTPDSIRGSLYRASVAEILHRKAVPACSDA